MGQSIKQRGNKNTLKQSRSRTFQNLWDAVKSSSKRVVHRDTGLPQETRKTSIKNLNLHLSKYRKNK